MANCEDLRSEVIEKGMCTFCGACMSACPQGFITPVNGKPTWAASGIEECRWCDKCYSSCFNAKREMVKMLNKMIFGRSKKEEFGVCRRILSARSLDDKVRRVGQDGGVVTSLLVYMLENTTIDGALVVGKEGWMPVALVATTKEQIISAAGTKYGAVPILNGLKAAVAEHGLRRVAIVGSPCHIQSARFLQHSNSPLGPIIKFTVGLFCRQNYEYKCVEEKAREQGLKPEEGDRFESALPYITSEGQKFSFPMSVAKNWVPRHCLICEDFTTELADVSVGSDGSAKGWSTVIVRSEEGEEVFSGAEKDNIIETMPLEKMDHIRQFAMRKKEKGKQTRDAVKLKEQGLEEKEIAAKLGITEEKVSSALERL